MLYSLNVKNIALIDEAGIEFGEGLNIFTGETGAGKSLVIGALTLALGGKLPKDIVRDEGAGADIELVFDNENEEVRRALKAADMDADEENIIIRRHISSGRSVIKLNDSTVTAAALKGITGSLIDIHGQHEHQKLLYEKNQLEILDAYGGEKLSGVAKRYESSYVNYKALLKKLEDFETDPAERIREADLLRYEVDEIDSAELKDGEDVKLEERFTAMNNSLKTAEHAAEAAMLIGEEEGSASEKTGRALRALRECASLDKGAHSLMEQLGEIDALMGDLRKDLEAYREGLNYSEEEFIFTRDRLDLINRLKLKYGRSLKEIEEAAEKRRRRLSELEDYDRSLADLKREIEENKQELLSLGAELSDIRRKAASGLEKKLKKELEELNFLEVGFEINITNDEENICENGLDEVRFLISTNPGEKLKPLSQVASGGELSRIMLAIKTVLADSDKTDTLIFDEIDVGVSGRTAQKVSESLYKLSRRHQVICITHLPQIAAMADHHFLIEKKVAGGKTRTCLKELKDGEAVEELSRLLGGAEITDTVVENAREMKALADRRKAGA